MLKVKTEKAQEELLKEDESPYKFTEEEFSKLNTMMIFILYAVSLFIFPYLFENLWYLLLYGIFVYTIFNTISNLKQRKINEVQKDIGKKKVWAVRYDLGKSRTGKKKLIVDHWYTFEDVARNLKKYNQKAEAKLYSDKFFYYAYEKKTEKSPFKDDTKTETTQEFEEWKKEFLQQEYDLPIEEPSKRDKINATELEYNPQKQAAQDAKKEAEAQKKKERFFKNLFKKGDTTLKENEIIRRIQQKESEKTIVLEFLQDELLKDLYRKKEGKEPFDNNKPTEEFMQWKEQFDSKEVIKKQIRNNIESLIEEQYDGALLERRLDYIAHVIANNHTLEEIEHARKEGMDKAVDPVHGFLQRKYRDHEELIQKYNILDRAFSIKQEEWEPEIITKLDEKIRLSNWKKSVVDFKRRYAFKEKPRSPFDKAIVYTYGEYFDQAINWEDGAQEDLEGFSDIPCSRGMSSIIEVGRTLFNVPMFFNAFSLGKNYVVTGLEIELEEIYKEIIRNNIMQIEDLLSDLVEESEARDHYEEQEKVQRKIASKYRSALNIMLGRYDSEKIIEDIDSDINEEEKLTTKDKLKFAGVIIFLIIAVIVIFIFMIPPNPANAGDPYNNSTRGMMSLLSFFWTVLKLQFIGVFP